MTNMPHKQDTDKPLSESSVSLKLEYIQRRCREHMGMGTADELELCLESSGETAPGDPYNDQSLSTTGTNRQLRNER